jgi:hypothetical protein
LNIPSVEITEISMVWREGPPLRPAPKRKKPTMVQSIYARRREELQTFPVDTWLKKSRWQMLKTILSRNKSI